MENALQRPGMDKWRLIGAALCCAWAGCSSCDSTTAPPVPSATASGSAPPAVTLSPTVSSRPVGSWPQQTQAFSAEQVAGLLPPEEGGRIELHDAGLDPKGVRRHALDQGATQTLHAAIDLAMKINQDGETTIPDVPALEVKVGVTTLEVQDGVASIEIRIDSAAIRKRGEVDDDVIEQIGPLVKKLPGVKATLRITSQGLRARSPKPPKEMPIELLQLWSSVAEAVTDSIVAFPAEAVGPGATWTVVDRQERAGVVMLRKTRMTLLDITDGDMRLSGEVVEGAIAGSAHDDALPKEIKIEVLEGVTVGKRRHTLRGAELWPLSSLSELSSDLTLRATATAGHFSDTKTSKTKLTQILRTVRADAARPDP